jgi:hypothetical protein
VAAGVGLALAWQRRDWKLPPRALLPVALPALALAGWWYWRNFTLYGDWTGVGHLVSINGQRIEPLEWDELWLEFRGLRYSFWGLFGWFNLLLPAWVYPLFDGVTVFALVGLAPALGQARSRGGRLRVLLLLLGWVMVSAGLVVYWIFVATGSQGRLFFPAISATVILLTLGLEWWWAWLPSRAADVTRLALPGLLLGCTLYAGAVIFPASYGALEPVAALPPSAQPVQIVYGDAEPIELVAIEPPTGRYYPGDWVPVTLYLTVPQRLTHDYELFIQLLDEQGEVMGNVTTHPGWGRLPTRLWEPGALYADRYTVQVRRKVDPQSPLLARIYTGFVDPASAELSPLTARTAQGEVVTPFPAAVVLLPFAPVEAAEIGAEPVGVRFGEGLALAGVDRPASVAAGQPLTVTLLWEATAPLATDLTAFVHLLGPDGAPVAGFDQGPGGERFPTRNWQPGDRVVQTMTLTPPETTPSGVYGLWVGVYTAASGGADRLPVQEAGDLESAHAMVHLGDVRLGN